MTITTRSMIRSQDVSTLQRLIDEIPCAIFILNSNGIFIECSKPCLNVFHLDNPDQIIGKSPEIISPPFQRNGKNSNEEIKKWILLACQNGSVTFNWDHKRLNGDIFPAKVTLSTSIYEGETCILATVIDNTGNVLEEEIEALINGNPYALIVLNPDLTIADVNPAFSRISGYNREEWISKNLSDFTILKRDGQTVEEAIKNKKTVSGKIIVQFPTGIRHMEYSYIPVFDANGELIKIYDIFADQTDIFEKLHESETLISENPTSIITTDINGNILQFNNSFLDLTRIPGDQLRTMNLADFKLLSREGATFSDALNSKNPEKGTMLVDFGDRIKVLEYTYLPVLDVNNAIQCDKKQ